MQRPDRGLILLPLPGGRETHTLLISGDHVGSVDSYPSPLLVVIVSEVCSNVSELLPMLNSNKTLVKATREVMRAPSHFQAAHVGRSLVVRSLSSHT